jgi:dephospho-CoA kinase
VGGKAVIVLEPIFPEAIIDGCVCRPKLAEIVLKDNSALKTLESIVHPLVAEEREKFLENAIHNGELAVA